MKEVKFAENLKNLREGASLTQKQLAQMLKVDQRTISAWEKRVCEPDFTLLAKICEIFNEDFNNLLT